MILRPSFSFYFLLLLYLDCSNFLFKKDFVFGGELAYFSTPQMTPGVSHRQNVCDRYVALSNGTRELKDVLQGMQLNVIVGNYAGSYFNYNNETGIEPYGGVVAEIMDELAKRAGFTWRNSFGISDVPVGVENETWTDLLAWSTETYDLSVDWWGRSLDRMNMGVAFLHDWYDSSIILVGKKDFQHLHGDDTLANFLLPFENNVWFVTVGTIFLGAIVFQLIERLSNDREDRSFTVLWWESFYLSWLNLTQAYEYGRPPSGAARIFGVSSAIWGLIMTATYTANLASLLVDGGVPDRSISTQRIEDIAYHEHVVCTWAGTIIDTHLEANYPSVKRRPKQELLDVYNALNSDECAFLADTTQGWLEQRNNQAFNRDCELEWVGGDRKIASIGAGFTAKADAGVKCTSLVRDTINYHMTQLVQDGFIEEIWKIENKRKRDNDCDYSGPGLQAVDSQGDAGSRRLERWQHQEIHGTENYRRRLKSSTKAASSAGALEGSGRTSNDQMTLEDMIKTFYLHWSLMAIALLVAVVQKWRRQKQEKAKKTKTFKKLYGCHSDENLEESLNIAKDELCHQIYLLNTALEESKKSDTRRREEQMQLREKVESLDDILQKFVRGTKEVHIQGSY